MSASRILPPSPPSRPIVLSIKDQKCDILEGVHTLTLFRGTIDMQRLREAVIRALECAPIFGGSLSKGTDKDIINCLICPLMCATGQDPKEMYSFMRVGWEDGGGAQLRSQPLSHELEAKLAAFGVDARDFWKSMTLLPDDEMKSLYDKVGNGKSLMKTKRPLTTILVSQGEELCVLGLSISHLIADGRSYYAFLGIVCQLYSSETQPPPPLPFRIAHFDNSLQKDRLAIYQRPCRSTMGPWASVTRTILFGSCTAQLCCNLFITGAEKPPTRIFTIRLTLDDQAKLKAMVAGAGRGETPPHSTFDALTEAFAPPDEYAPYIFGIVTDLRGRAPSVPRMSQQPTSGNIDDILLKPVKRGQHQGHSDARRLANDGFTGSAGALPLPLSAACSNRAWGWNSWDSVQQDFLFPRDTVGPTLAGLELITHREALYPAGSWSGVYWMRGFVVRADGEGTRTLRLDPVSATHAEQIQQTLERLGIDYICVDQDSRVRASSAAAGALYDDADERRLHDLNGSSCGGLGWCCSAACIGCCLYLNLVKCVGSVPCLFHSTPCYPYESCCSVEVGSMRGEEYASERVSSLIPLVPEAQKMSRGGS